jgi:hypothetical protein
VGRGRAVLRLLTNETNVFPCDDCHEEFLLAFSTILAHLGACIKWLNRKGVPTSPARRRAGSLRGSEGNVFDIVNSVHNNE